jgi:hypothetical protein
MVRFCPQVLFALVLALLIGAGPATAGPWAREYRHFFTSTTSTLRAADGWLPQQSEFYAEYGLRPRLTIGAAASLSWRLDYADVFVRWHPFDLPHGLAFGITGGLRYVPHSLAPHQPFMALDFGRGMELGGGNLWMQTGVRVYTARAPWGQEIATDWRAEVGFSRGRWLGMLAATHSKAPASASPGCARQSASG